MSDYLFLVPISLALALIALGAFLWSLRHEQYDDLDGAAERVLFAEDRPLGTQAQVSPHIVTATVEPHAKHRPDDASAGRARAVESDRP